MTPTPLISVDNITVRLRDRWLLEGTSWRIHTGELWAVVGPNGSGKTTLAKAVAGRLPIVGGEIRYPGFDGAAPHEAIAYVASDDRRDLWRRETTLDHARNFAGRHLDRTTVREWLDRGSIDSESLGRADMVRCLGLSNLLDKPLMAISTGEMSRLMVARALVRHPRMLVLDEPFEGLDGPSRRELMAMLNGLAVSGLPMILITHRSDEILPATTHILTIDAGRIASAGPVALSPRGFEGLTAMATGETGGHRLDISDVGLDEDVRFRSEALIDMQAVTVRYDDTIVLDRLTWSVAPGENWAVTGPNGAGKSTLLKLITGECLQVFANRIRLFGKERRSDLTLWNLRERLAVVSHDLAAAYQRQMSARDVVCSGFFDSVGLYRNCDSEQRAIAAAWLAHMGLSAMGRVPFNQLSQGQRQMVLIARAMVKCPQLLILDEPCTGLDPDNRGRVLEAVTRIGSRDATGLIFVTHHEVEIPACTTHRLILDRGRVVYCGPIRRQ